MSASPAWYALRRTLPPWSFDRNLAELVEQLPRYGVDEVIVKVDTEEFTHGQPILEWVRAYQDKLHQVREAMSELGVVYSLNPWITVGHNDRGRDSRRQLPGLGTMVGHDGTTCRTCACPLDPVWRENIAAVWSLYAETQPHVIWVEDDIRTFNHRPATFTCFCEEHLRRFSQEIGRSVSREEVMEALLAPGEPHPWREIWLRLQSAGINDTVRFLAQTVHAVSPETALGLMSSGPRAHAMEARQWATLAESLADGGPLYSRPPMSNYAELNLRGFYYSHDSIKITRHCLPGAIEQTEVENVPFTCYSKSITFTMLEMAISFAYGSHGVTMNLYDHAGTPMEADPGLGRMLGDRKPYFEGLASRARQAGRYRGVQLLHHERNGLVKHLPPDAPYASLREDGDELHVMFESLGIPTTYDDEQVVVACGQQLRAYDDDFLRELLSGSLWLDATAACVLAERGFAAELGLRKIAAPVHLDSLGAFAAEEFHHPAFGGADQQFMTLTIPNLGGRPHVSLVELSEDAQVISHLVDPDIQRHHVGMYAYENALGGRVVVHCLDLKSAYGTAFCHPYRAQQMQGAIRWLSHEAPVLQVNGGVYPLAFRKDCSDFTLLGFFNLSLDAWATIDFTLDLEQAPSRIEMLAEDGRWQPTGTARWADGVLHWPQPVPHDTPLFLTLYR